MAYDELTTIAPGEICDIYTNEEMSIVLSAENLGKIYRFMGTSGTYINGDLYEVKYRLLPSEYTELAYIQATGSQWTDLGFADTSGIIVNFKCAWQGTSGYVVGSHNPSDPYGRNSGYMDYARHFWELGYGDYCPQNSDAPRELDHAYEVEFSTVVGNAYLKVDNTTYITDTRTTTISNLNVLLFSNQYPSGTPTVGTAATLYYAKIKDHTGTLIRDLVPCKNSLDVPGFYDFVNNRFYYSDTSTAYIAGPVVD